MNFLELVLGTSVIGGAHIAGISHTFCHAQNHCRGVTICLFFITVMSLPHTLKFGSPELIAKVGL